MGFYLHATDGKKEKGDKQINPKAVEILKKHVKQDLKLSKVRRAHERKLTVLRKVQCCAAEVPLIIGSSSKRNELPPF
jgi:hypothetical protein